VYDGSTTIAALSGTPAGVVTGDMVQLNGAGTYANKNAATGKTYTLTNLSLSGTDASNYGLSTGASLTATNGVVTAKAITVTGIAANDKVYDAGNTAAMNVSGAVFNGMVAGDALSVTATGTFGSANVAYNGSSVTSQTVTFANNYGGADVGNYTYAGSPTTTTAKITPKSLTLSNVAANDKTYDGNTNATISSFGSFSGVLGSDAVSLVSTGYSASFADKNVVYDANSAVTSKTVTVLASSLGLTGLQSANYQLLGNPSATAKINRLGVQATGITANNKVYDGTNAATVSVSGASFTGMLANDVLAVASTGVFANVGGVVGTAKNVGTGKTVTLTSTYGGADLSNYSITDQASTTANITTKALTVSGLVANNREYDGTNVATITTSNAMFTGLVAGDALTVSATGVFDDIGGVVGTGKNVGTAKAVTLSSAYAGADRNNYSITSQTSSTANISPKALTVSNITVADKVYDGTASSTVNSSAPTLTGLVSGDTVTVSATGVFSDENVGTGKTVTLTSSYSGSDRNNYSITGQPTATANISKLDVALSGDTGLTKVYDATVSVAPALTNPATGYGGLSVAINTSALTADQAVSGGLVITGAPVFSDPNVGNVTVQQGSVLLTGTRAGNYNLVWTAPAATITKAPLTVTSNDDAKFYSQNDTAGFEGVRYSGFVGGQTAAVLGGALSVTRPRTGLSGTQDQDDIGTYTGALVPAGLTSSNYQLTFVNGNYTMSLDTHDIISNITIVV
jgi:hypothetical protein